MDKSRDTAHAQWLKTQCQWYPKGDVMTHNSRKSRRRIFKLRERVDDVTRHIRQLLKVKRLNIKVTRLCNVYATITL